MATDLADKSWGDTPSPGFRVGTTDATDRADARASRIAGRAAATSDRLRERADARQASANAREAARVARLEMERSAVADAFAVDTHAAAGRHRSSGRKDVVREQRDTRGYTTVVDIERMRTLADRGASIAGLAGAFGISEADVEHALTNGG